MKLEALYVFGGEKAQGAEIVIERLIGYNAEQVNAHLMLSPGTFADKLIAAEKPFKIICVSNLKKLYRSSTNKFNFYRKALINYFMIPLQVYRYVKANNITVIHVNTIVPASYLLPLVFLSKILLPRRLWLWSDHDMKYFSGLDHRLSKWCLKYYDYTLVVSQAVKRKYPESDKTIVLYNGLDTKQFKYDEAARKGFREHLDIDYNCIVFGIAASICPGKGQLPLIEAFNSANLIYPNMKLLLVGDFAFDDIAYNEAMKKAMVSNANIIFLGFTNSIVNFYNGCDVIVSNSDLTRSESLGTSIYEAMACEKIVIASATGGTPEIITDNIDGFLFEPESSNALKERILYVGKAYDTLQNVKIAARQKVKNKFNIEGMVDFYNDFLAGHIKN